MKRYKPLLESSKPTSFEEIVERVIKEESNKNIKLQENLSDVINGTKETINSLVSIYHSLSHTNLKKKNKYMRSLRKILQYTVELDHDVSKEANINSVANNMGYK